MDCGQELFRHGSRIFGFSQSARLEEAALGGTSGEASSKLLAGREGEL